MTKIDPAMLFAELVKSVGEKLKEFGYSRRGQTFKIIANNNCGMINFQRSTSSTKENISFTINLGMVYGDLLDQRITQLKDAKITDAHIHQRMGYLLTSQQDKWWQLNNSINFEQLSGEIMDLLSIKAVPFVGNFLDTKSIYSLWESGSSPGLTEFQRVRFLSKLKGRLSN